MPIIAWGKFAGGLESEPSAVRGLRSIPPSIFVVSQRITGCIHDKGHVHLYEANKFFMNVSRSHTVNEFLTNQRMRAPLRRRRSPSRPGSLPYHRPRSTVHRPFRRLPFAVCGLSCRPWSVVRRPHSFIRSLFVDGLPRQPQKPVIPPSTVHFCRPPSAVCGLSCRPPSAVCRVVYLSFRKFELLYPSPSLLR
jgi:hypothetical protein